jgi:hypothetical protein
MIYSNKIVFGMSNSISNLKEKETVRWATRIPGKDHWHQTAVTTFTENGPFQDYTRKTALFRAIQIFQKVTKVVVNSQINVSFSPAPI